MNSRILILCFVLFLFSCKKEEDSGPVKNYPSEINFEIAEHYFSGMEIKTIEFCDEGYYYSVGNIIYFESWAGNVKSSAIISSAVLDLAYNKKEEALYVGTRESGLGRLKNGDVRYFTVENSGLPRNVIAHVVCDEDGRIWFSSSAHMLGGLVQYNGNSFSIFLPENSHLPDNLIKDIEYKNGKVYVSTGGTVGGQSVYRISKESHNNYRWENIITDGGYYFMNMTIDNQGNLYIIDDCGLSSYSGSTNKIIKILPDGTINLISPDESRFTYIPYFLKIDKRDYLWATQFQSETHEKLSVFDGTEWYEAPEEFPDDFINCIEVDEENNIWLGTENGIYILNQN